MMFNGMGDNWRFMTRDDLENCTRSALVEWLEFRGCACYDDEPTELLREAALEDYDGETGQAIAAIFFHSRLFFS